MGSTNENLRASARFSKFLLSQLYFGSWGVRFREDCARIMNHGHHWMTTARISAEAQYSLNYHSLEAVFIDPQLSLRSVPNILKMEYSRTQF
jgi:hypothetical protein